MAETPSWLSQYPEVKDDSWLDQYKEVKEKPFLDISETASALGRAATSLPTTTMASLSQAWEGLDNPWKRSEGYFARRQEMQALQDELAKEEEEAAASGDISTVSSTIREATPSLGFSGATLIPSMGAAAGTLALSKSPMAARGAAAATSALMAYRMAGAQFLDDAKDRIDSFFAENLNREPTEQEKEEAYQELLPLARKFGAAEAGPEALGNLALGGAGKYIRRALGGKNGVMELASNALGKVTGTKAALAGAGALVSEIGTEAVTGVEQQRIQKQFEEGVMRGESPESVPLEERTLDDYIKSFKEVAPATMAMTGMMGAAGLGPTAIARGIKALRPTPPERQTQIQKDLQAEAGAIPKDTVPDQTNEEKLAAMEAGGTTVVDPDGKTAVIPPQQPELPSMPSPDEVAVQLNTDAAKSLEAAGSSESAKAQAGFDATLKEIFPKTSQPTIQPEQAAEEVAPEVTLNEPTFPKEPELQPENIPNLEGGPFAEAKVPVSEEVIQPTPQALNAPDQITDQESLRQEPENRVESREEKESSIGNILLDSANSQEEEKLIRDRNSSVRGAYSSVFSNINNLKVADSIISNLPVNVVNLFGGKEGASQVLLHNPTVLQDTLTIYGDSNIPMLSGDSRMLAVARLRAKLLSFEPAGRNTKLLTALKALDDNLLKIVRLSTNGGSQLEGQTNIPSSDIGASFGTKAGTFPPVKGDIKSGVANSTSFSNPAMDSDIGHAGIFSSKYPKSSTSSSKKEKSIQPITPKGTPTLATEGTPTSRDVGTERDATKPEQMTREEHLNAWNQLNIDAQKAREKANAAKAKLLPKNPASKIRQMEKNAKLDQEAITLENLRDEFPPTPSSAIENAVKEGKPFSVDLHKASGYAYIPSGYTRQGDLYVFQPGATGATPVQAAPPAAQVATAPQEEVVREANETMTIAEIGDELHALGAGENTFISDLSPRGVRGSQTRNLPFRQDIEGLVGRAITDDEWIELQGAYEDGRRVEESLTQAAAPSAAQAVKATAPGPISQTTAAVKQTPAPSRKGAGAAGVTERQPSGGSIPEVGEVSPETEISSRENLGPKAAAAKKKQAAADEAAKKRQEKQDNATKSSLNSVVGPQKEDAIQGTVTKVDVETAREALTNSGEIPNAYLTNVYESLEAFLADKANARLFPSAYARLQTEKNIEGLYENGQTLIFAKQIQVSNLDRNLATMLGLTPEQAAARRVIAHENGHKAISLFTMAEKRELRGYLMRAYSDEQIAKLVETYDEYADWRTNLESRFEALEELLMRDFEKMEKIPTGGVWDNIVQFLKRVWRRLTGQNGEPTLKNLKDVARLMRNAMKRPAVPLGSFTLKDGGKVKLSAIAPTAGITPEMDAEYLAAVEAGDMEKAQRMVDEAAKKAGYILEKVFHGGASPLTDLSKGSSRGQAVAFFTRSKQDAWYYAFLGTPRKLAGTNLSGARRRQLSEKPQRNPSVTSVYIKGPIFDFSEGTTLTELQTWREILEIFGDKRIASEIRDWSPSIYEKFNDEQSLGETSAETFKEWINERWDDLLEEARDAGATEETLALSNTPVLLFLKSTQLLDEWAAAKNIEAVEYDDAETGAKTVTINNPNNAKSAAPITRDDAGKVIPPSQRFQPTSPDIRFSRPQFASDTDAATSAGNEAARSTIYSERDMDVREAIRRAYEAMPKDTSVAVPIGELFAKTEELMPGVTQDEFSNVLQDLFEDNGAVLQEGEQIIPEQEVEIQAFEKDNPFNELIRKSTEKSPSLGEINGVSKKFVQRVLRPASNFATNNGIRIDDNAPLQVRAMPDGSIIIGYSLSQERFDELQKMAPQAASQYTKDSVIEELIHLSDLIGLRNQWIKSGKKISFDQFVLGEQSNLAFSLIQKADSLNDLEAESLRRILASSLSLYNNNPEIANLGLNELLDLAAQYPYVLPELVRSLIQLKKTGQLTETAFRKIANVLREWQEIILQWISDGYASAKEGVFGEMLSERIKNAENNLAQLSDTSEINVTTPEGRRAGFVVVMPRAAKASKIPIDEIKEASKPFKEDLIEASKGREEKAAFKGNVMRGNVVPDHNVNATELYKKAANDLLDSLLKNHDILDVAESVQDPDLQAELGMQIGGVVQPEDILNVRQYLGALLQRRLTVAISSEKNPKRLRQLEMARRSINAYSDGASGGGTALNNAKQVQNDPELKGDFFFSQATREKAQKAKDKLDAITGGTEKITDIITGAEQKAAEETTQAEVEAQESAVEDDQDAALIREGEETLDNESKNLWEKAKMLIMRLAMYARADKSDVKTGSKASLTAEQRDELNAILRMPKAERDKARAKDEAELKAVLRKLIGEESEAKTSEQKKTRQKRVKMIDVVRKYSESGKSIDLADQQTALKGMLREMNKARPADSVPFERAMPWRKILSSNPKDVAEYRQRIFEAISDLPSFQNLTDEQKERLADLYAEAWENRKQAILDRMLRDEIKKARDRDEISEDVEKKLQQSRNKILEIVNLGGFNNDDLVKVLGERYGISTSFTEEQKERIQKLADQLQDEDMNTAKRNKLAMEFAVELAGAMDVPVSEIISNWWTSSVLFGPQTIFSIGAAFLNGGYSIATIGTRRMLAKLVKGDIQGAIEESILMLKGFARYLGAFKQSGRRAWSYLWTGDVGLLGTGSTDILSEINNFDQLQRFQRHKLLAEQLAKDPRMVRRYVGVYLRFVSRLLTALDAFNVMVTKAGTASLALRMSGMSTDKIIEAEKMLNLKAYKDQVIRDYFDNKAPKTQAEKALVDSYAEAEMYRAINKLGGKMENADYLASESAMTMHPTGFGGVVYDAITGFFAQRQSNADEYLEKMKKDWISNKDLKAVTFLALAYLRQFAAYNAAGLTGSKFVRYASNKFNQGLSFIPFAGLLRQIEAKDDRIKGKDAFRETIYRNQIVSFVMLMVGYSVIKAIQDEPDDEERGNFWNGGWANLTPDQKKQMLAKGQKEYTMGFKFNGRWYVFNYQNWPLNQILSAIGSMSDQIRFSPEKWDEKSALSKGVAGMVSGVKSTLEIPALSGLQELVGNRLASKDPTEKDLDRLSRVASGWVGGFVPRILKDIDFYTQPELRKYEGLWEKTASHIPIYRRYVGEEYYDILGQQIKRNVIPGSREFMMGPTEPEYKILGALNARNIFLTPANAEYRMVGKGRNRRRLTQEEADAYSLETGRGYRDMLLRYGQRALQMPTERARAFLQDKAEEVRDRALKRVYRR